MSYVTRLGKSLKTFYACNLWAWQAKLVYFKTPNSNNNIQYLLKQASLFMKVKLFVKLSNKIITYSMPK